MTFAAAVAAKEYPLQRVYPPKCVTSVLDPTLADSQFFQPTFSFSNTKSSRTHNVCWRENYHIGCVAQMRAFFSPARLHCVMNAVRIFVVNGFRATWVVCVADGSGVPKNNAEERTTLLQMKTKELKNRELDEIADKPAAAVMRLQAMDAQGKSLLELDVSCDAALSEESAVTTLPLYFLETNPANIAWTTFAFPRTVTTAKIVSALAVAQKGRRTTTAVWISRWGTVKIAPTILSGEPSAEKAKIDRNL